MALHASVTLDISKLGKVTPATINALAGGLYREGQNILTISRLQCPVDTGNLRASGYVTLPNITPNYISVEAGYQAEYALIVHERLDVHHPVGNAKFLERPMNDRMDDFVQNIANEIIPTLASL